MYVLTSVNVLINVVERGFHLNNVNFYVKNMDRLIQMGKDLGYEGGKLQDSVKQQQDYERGERIAERELERDRIAAEEAKAEKMGLLVVLRLNVPVNNFSVMSGRSHRFLGN